MSMLINHPDKNARTPKLEETRTKRKANPIEESTVKKNPRGCPSLKKQEQKIKANPIEESTIKKNSRGRPSLKKQEQKRKANPIEESTVKKNPRGRPSLKKQEQKRKANPIEEPTLLFVSVSVKIDGLKFVKNCPGFAPKRNWMIMPDTGVLIANWYGVVVNYLSKEGSSTCFPLWKGHGEIGDHRVFSIARVHGNHFTKLQLEGEYPMPTIVYLWSHQKHQSTTRWKSLYSGRLEMYAQFLPTLSSDDVIDTKESSSSTE
ncbi:hypothetical protein QVD17_28492 [Tagetes erecta]|uniref:Uncharacterized protein n=1 Tax=Tagetes erecta TaxID=13708 RepID=A0AAD8NS85_TARER|nr:hypothetical protein QVD17_28492 [Tagetes erecta]